MSEPQCDSNWVQKSATAARALAEGADIRLEPWRKPRTISAPITAPHVPPSPIPPPNPLPSLMQSGDDSPYSGPKASSTAWQQLAPLWNSDAACVVLFMSLFVRFQEAGKSARLHRVAEG